VSTPSLLHAIVQSTNVELFHSRGVAIAPLPVTTFAATRQRHSSLVGFVTFQAPEAYGYLALSMPEQVYELFVPHIVDSQARDTTRELVNQLVGRIKNRLLQFQVVLRIGLPSATGARTFESQHPTTGNEAVYCFRTLRGHVVVSIDATVDESAFNYSSAHAVAKEGDFIAF
jgi:hypothetical protein